MPPQITRRETIYEGWSTFEKVFVRLPDGSEIVREVESHGSAAAVLPYDPERRSCWLIRTVRAPILMADLPPLLEAPAGLIDTGETSDDAVRREAEEEVGMRLRDLESLGAFWPSPGVGCERLHLYLAEASLTDRVSKGGGLAEEHEQIQVIELPLSEVLATYDRGEIADMKTGLLLLELLRRHPALFQSG